MVQEYNVCGRTFKVINGEYVMSGNDCCKKIIGDEYLLCEKKEDEISINCDDCSTTYNGISVNDDLRLSSISCYEINNCSYNLIKVNNYGVNFDISKFCYIDTIANDGFNLYFMDANVKSSYMNFQNVKSYRYIGIEYDTINTLEEIVLFFQNVTIYNNYDLNLEFSSLNVNKRIYVKVDNVIRKRLDVDIYNSNINEVIFETTSYFDTNNFNLHIISSSFSKITIYNATDSLKNYLLDEYSNINFIFL